MVTFTIQLTIQYHLETTWLPVNNDWYGEGEDEDAAESAQAAD